MGTSDERNSKTTVNNTEFIRMHVGKWWTTTSKNFPNFAFEYSNTLQTFFERAFVCVSSYLSLPRLSRGMFNTILIEFYRRFRTDLFSFDRFHVFVRQFDSLFRGLVPLLHCSISWEVDGQNTIVWSTEKVCR